VHFYVWGRWLKDFSEFWCWYMWIIYEKRYQELIEICLMWSKSPVFLSLIATEGKSLSGCHINCTVDIILESCHVDAEIMCDRHCAQLVLESMWHKHRLHALTYLYDKWQVSNIIQSYTATSLKHHLIAGCVVHSWPRCVMVDHLWSHQISGYASRDNMSSDLRVCQQRQYVIRSPVMPAEIICHQVIVSFHSWQPWLHYPWPLLATSLREL
jgi:hypothetical protein